MQWLLAPEGVKSVECNDGSVFDVPFDRRIEVHEAAAAGLIEAGFTPIGARPQPSGESVTYVELKHRDGTSQGLVRVYGKFDPKPGERGEKGEIGSSGGDGPPGKDGVEGLPGPIGPMPAHRWVGTELQFEMSPGVWGVLVDLKGDRGDRGPMGKTGLTGKDGADGAPGRGGVGGGGTVILNPNGWAPAGWQ